MSPCCMFNGQMPRKYHGARASKETEEGRGAEGTEHGSTAAGSSRGDAALSCARSRAQRGSVTCHRTRVFPYNKSRRRFIAREQSRDSRSLFLHFHFKGADLKRPGHHVAISEL